MINLICVAGPTASGKTAFAIELAKRLNGEIISADSMQIYKGMDIGTAKPDKDEMQGIKHYLIDEVSPFESFDVSCFTELAKKYINEITEKGKIPIVAGGTGLFINSLIDNVEFYSDNTDESLREELSKIASEKGNEYLHSILKECDPESAQNIHPNNVKRVIRAIEACKTTGVPFSEQKRLSKKNNSPYNLVYFGLNMEREILYDRINRRVDIMLEKGLLNEVKKLKEEGLNLSYNSMQGIGYKEILKYLNGETTLEEAVCEIKLFSRRYAKRQLTWFGRDERICWLDSSKGINMEEVVKNIKEKLNIK